MIAVLIFGGIGFLYYLMYAWTSYRDCCDKIHEEQRRESEMKWRRNQMAELTRLRKERGLPAPTRSIREIFYPDVPEDINNSDSIV